MRNFLTKSVPGLMAIAVVAGLGYFVLTPPSMPAARAAAPEIGAHNAACSLCRLPLYGQSGEGSRLGIDAHAIETASKAIH
jgi:hypothetical protein